MDINDAIELVNGLQPVDKQAAEQVEIELNRLADMIRNKLEDIGLEFEIEVSFGGEWLVLEEENYAGLTRGEWMNSSYSC